LSHICQAGTTRKEDRVSWKNPAWAGTIVKEERTTAEQTVSPRGERKGGEEGRERLEGGRWWVLINRSNNKEG